MTTNFSYVRASSVKEAIKLLSSANARVHAGGTDLLGCLRDQVFQAERLVSISRLKELKGIRESGEGIRIGAMTTVSDLAENEMIRKGYAVLSEAAASVASPQLRNQGTIGGNICQKPRCWYYRGEFACRRKGGDRCYAVAGENQYHSVLGGSACYMVHPSDIATALVALGAKISISGPKGQRTVAAENFFVPPDRDIRRETVLSHDEIVTEIVVPKAADGLRSRYRKVQVRRSWDFAIASLALAIRFSGDTVSQAHIVLGAAAPIPWRCRDVEGILFHKRIDAGTVQKAVDAVMKDARPLEKNGYKVPLFRGILEEELLAISP